MVIIKVIQILLIVTNRESVVKDPFATKELAVCLKAFNYKSTITRNNIFAVMRQMYSLLFGEYADAIKLRTKNGKLEDEEIHRICLKQIEVLIEVAKEKNDRAYKGLGLDMLTSILAEYPLKESLQVVALLENSYVSSLAECLVEEANVFPIATRAVKATTQLILALQNFYDLLQPILLLTDSQESWQWYLSLECFCVLLGDYRQVKNMHTMINDVRSTRVNCIVTP
eukprot:TRINITY_DN11360_c0_g1_i2.p1 TRINITY_DN11360_c0_g1~~TRINITY_DN11360_c0_g1_i2.p1  ORF type:complete len:227 (-),score=51.79 TRINITY_DN11360_c0_g1_i2:123-803(-)